MLQDMLAASIESIEKEINRYIGRSVESATVDGDNITFVSCGHGLRAGDIVRVHGDTAIDATVVSVASRHEFTASGLDSDVSGKTLSKHFIDQLMPSYGGEIAWLRPATVQEILSLSVRSCGSEYTELETTEYQLLDSGSSDAQGEVLRISGTWPVNVSRSRFGRIIDRYAMPAGIKASWVGGYVSIPSLLSVCVLQMIQLLIESSEDSGLTSETYDYYTWTRTASDAVFRLPGAIKSNLETFKVAL
ncbi:hypothetical protein [Rosistilla oblonga]|uniref:hypothetical protein n=1 Tax=Rosistilla oblonga TaxID=2527990 RepID=UPI003A97B183